MKKLFIRLLVRLLKYLQPNLNVLSDYMGFHYALVLDSSTDHLIAEAFKIVQYCALMYETQSGEFKRHVAYAKMLKKFPTSDKRDLSLAIELALRRL